MQFNLVEFNPLNADERHWQLFIDFHNKYHDLINKGDPKEPDDILKKQIIIQAKSPEINFTMFQIMPENTDELAGVFIYAFFSESSPSYEQNKHIAMVELAILPKYRHMGIATKVIKKLVDYCKKDNKTIIISSGEEKEGEEFIKYIGGIVALKEIENRVYLKDINWDMINDWIKQGSERNSDVTIRFFERVPDDIIDEFCKMYTETINQVPMGDLDVKDLTFTPETLRREEEDRAKIGRIKHTVITIQPNGEISAMSELMYSPTNPKIMHQGLTSTREKYRGNGLGKWVKALMLNKIKKEYTDVEFISTGNATTNAPMLSINKRIGFKEHKISMNFQITIEQLEKYLNR